MEKKKIAIIGAGNMGGAIVNGLLKSGFIASSEIYISDPKISILKDFEAKGVNISERNQDIAKAADVIIIAVKPYHFSTVAKELKPVLSSEKILISIVAGVEINHIESEAGKEVPVFRAMPNTAISLQESLTCISTNGKSIAHLDYVVELFDNLGKTVVINEELMAAATVLSS
ncbi:MAG: NAD(P)-binding domain-containing protein, partial [Prolixibacteraceae bacterium]|nr:NAD(P)-binding domain-containing protein [Prolixibacteraceae bacterium]MBN2772732.1 NAD(P)-binding domain-containing protein [Prolixibacteraceae bacterium]